MLLKNVFKTKPVELFINKLKWVIWVNESFGSMSHLGVMSQIRQWVKLVNESFGSMSLMSQRFILANLWYKLNKTLQDVLLLVNNTILYDKPLPNIMITADYFLIVSHPQDIYHSHLSQDPRIHQVKTGSLFQFTSDLQLCKMYSQLPQSILH